MKSQLDNSDRIILALIQEDNTLGLEYLASKCDLSVTSVQRRLKKMRKDKIIDKEIAVINPAAVDQNMTFVITIKLERERLDMLDAFRKMVRKDIQVQQCYYVTGEADFIVICTAKDMKDFEVLTHRLFFDNQNVRSFKTSVVMDRTKVGLAVSTNG
jgi:Lrp/AsnC family leucine-responsive transcriptional regulator